MTKQKLNLVQWIVVLPRMGRIYVLCVAGHKTKTAKTLSCGFLFYHGLDGLDGLDGFACGGDRSKSFWGLRRRFALGLPS